jgi:uncharacterized protein DUF1566/chitobiase/beta-hexosaminidase-like protein/Big-like domain-containing protein
MRKLTAALLAAITMLFSPASASAAYQTTLEAKLFDGLTMYSRNEADVTQLYFYNDTALNYGLMSVTDYERHKAGEGLLGSAVTMGQRTNLIPGRVSFLDVEETIESVCQKLTKPTTADDVTSRAVRSEMLLSEAFPGILETNQFKGVLFNGSAPGKMNLPMLVDSFQIAAAVASASNGAVKNFINNKLGKIESQAKAVAGTITALELLLDPAADTVGVLSLGKYSSDIQQWRDNLDAIQEGFLNLMPPGTIDNDLFAFNAEEFEKSLVDPNTGKAKVSCLKLLASLGAPTENNKAKIKLWISTGAKKEKKIAAIILAVDAANRIFRILNSWYNSDQLSTSDTLELVKFITTELVTDYVQYSVQNAACSQVQDKFADTVGKNKWYNLLNLLNVSAGKAWSEASRPSEIYFTVRRDPSTGKLSVDHSISNIKSRGYSLIQAPSGDSWFDQRYVLQPVVATDISRTSMLVAEYPQQPIVMLARQGLRVAPQVLVTIPQSATNVSGYFDASAGSTKAIYAALKTDLLGKSSTTGQYIWANLASKSYESTVSFATAASTTNLLNQPITFDRRYASLEEKRLGLPSGSYDITNFSNINSMNVLQKGDMVFSAIGGYKISINLGIDKVDSITNGVANAGKAVQQQGEFRFYVLPNYDLSQAPGVIDSSEILFDGGRRSLFISNKAGDILTGFRRTSTDGSIGWFARVAIKGTDGAYQRIVTKGFSGELDGKQGYFLPIPANFFKAPIQSVTLYDPLIDAYTDLEGVQFDDALKGALVIMLSDTGTTQLASAVEIPWFRLNKTGDTISPTVSVSPSGGTFETEQQVTITANEPSAIYYTTNGSTPDESSSVYPGPITISSTTTLKFMAADSVGNRSTIKSVNFQIKNFSTSPYLEIQAPAAVRIQSTSDNGRALLKLISADKIRLYPRNTPGWPDFNGLVGEIKVWLVDQNDMPYLVPGTLLSDGGVEFSINADMPANEYYRVVAQYSLDGQNKILTPGFPLQQVTEISSASGSGGGYNGGGGTSSIPAITLPRTGQYLCYDPSGATITCDGTGQDGEIQAGAVWPVPRFVDNGDQTVADKLTGLVWAKDANTPGPAACGPGTTKTWQGALDYVVCLNDSSYLGYSDWRLPNRYELESLINYGQSSPYQWLNNQGFSSIQADSYWSSSTSAPSYAYRAWSANMYDGDVYFYSKYENLYAWPVRKGTMPTTTLSPPQTGQVSCYSASGALIGCAGTGQDGDLQEGTNWPTPRFTINGDGTASDNLTGLMWTQNASIEYGYKSWQQALDYVNAMNIGVYANFGHTDWRLPNTIEMKSLMKIGQTTFLWLDNQGFSNVQAGSYWTSNSYNNSVDYAWTVGMGYGEIFYDKKTRSSYSFWPVRGGQIDAPRIIPSVPSITFLSENFPNGSFQLGPATKSWRFKSGSSPITGLKAVQVPGKTDSGLGITQAEIAIGDVAANTEFVVNLPIGPVHDAVPIKSSYWKLVDGNGQDVTITNSQSNQFWLKLRTNRLPAFSQLQLDSVAGQANNQVSLPILASDPDGDTLAYSVISGGGSIVEGVWQGKPAKLYRNTFATSGVQPVTIRVDDGHGDSAEYTIHAVITPDGHIANFFKDVPYSSDPVANRQQYDQYLAIHYLALNGITIGRPDPADATSRIFEGNNVAKQAEALAMVMKAASLRGILDLDAEPRYLPNLIREDVPNGVYYNFSWAAPYVLKAEGLGLIDSADTFDPAAPATRAWLANIVSILLKLDPPQDAITSPDAYSFADATDFAATVDYNNARAMAFFGYMGKLGSASIFHPKDSMIRADVAVVTARILQTPSLDGFTTPGLAQQTVSGAQMPAITHGQSFTVTGLTNLKTHAILDNGGSISEDWLNNAQDYVKVAVMRAGSGVVAQDILAKDLATAPVVVPTNPPDISATEIRNLLVLIEDTKSGVRTVSRLDYGVVFPDSDGDGVRDDQDRWPTNPLFSTDGNANGIPDNADALWGLASRKGNDVVTINGQSMTLIGAVLNNVLANDTTPPVTSSTVLTGTYGFPQTVTLNASETAVIRYTTDGNDPTVTSPVYAGPIFVICTTTLKFYAIDLAGNVEAVKIVTITIDTSSRLLTVTIFGQGTVNSATPGAAFTCANGSCTQSFPANTSLTLAASASFGSLFSGWTGGCTNIIGDCLVRLDADKGVTATFTATPPFRIVGTATTYYTTLAAALADLMDGSTVTLHGRTVYLPGGFILGRPVNLTIKGGFDAAFSSIMPGGMTVVGAPLVVGSGSLAVENLAVQ